MPGPEGDCEGGTNQDPVYGVLDGVICQVACCKTLFFKGDLLRLLKLKIGCRDSCLMMSHAVTITAGNWKGHLMEMSAHLPAVAMRASSAEGCPWKQISPIERRRVRVKAAGVSTRQQALVFVASGSALQCQVQTHEERSCKLLARIRCATRTGRGHRAQGGIESHSWLDLNSCLSPPLPLRSCFVWLCSLRRVSAFPPVMFQSVRASLLFA